MACQRTRRSHVHHTYSCWGQEVDINSYGSYPFVPIALSNSCFHLGVDGYGKQAVTGKQTRKKTLTKLSRLRTVGCCTLQAVNSLLCCTMLHTAGLLQTVLDPVV